MCAGHRRSPISGAVTDLGSNHPTMDYIGGENSPAGEGGGDFEEDTPAVEENSPAGEGGGDFEEDTPEEIHSSEEEADTAPVEAMDLSTTRSVPAPESTPVTVDPYLPPPGSSFGESASSSSATGEEAAFAAAATVLAEFDEIFSQRTQVLKQLRDEIYRLWLRKHVLEREVRNLEKRCNKRCN